MALKIDRNKRPLAARILYGKDGPPKQAAPAPAPTKRERTLQATTRERILPMRTPKDYVSPNVEDRRFEHVPVPATQASIEAAKERRAEEAQKRQETAQSAEVSPWLIAGGVAVVGLGLWWVLK